METICKLKKETKTMNIIIKCNTIVSYASGFKTILLNCSHESCFEYQKLKEKRQYVDKVFIVNSCLFID